MKNINSKIFILAILMAVFSIHIQAQNVYVKLNTGYNAGLSSIDDASSNQVGNVTTISRSKISLGKGINIGGAVGYMFNKFIGTELNISYLIGGTSTTNSVYASTSYSSSQNFSISSKMLQFTPSIILTPGFSKINPYARFGFLMGMTNINYDIDATNSSTFGGTTTTNHTNESFLMNGGLAIGFTGSLGVSYLINEHFSLTGELTGANISYAPKNGEITGYKQNGVDQLSTLNTSERKVEFVNAYSEDSSNPNNDAPGKSIAPTFSYNNIGFHLGVKYTLF